MTQGEVGAIGGYVVGVLILASSDPQVHAIDATTGVVSREEPGLPLLEPQRQIGPTAGTKARLVVLDVLHVQRDQFSAE